MSPKKDRRDSGNKTSAELLFQPPSCPETTVEGFRTQCFSGSPKHNTLSQTGCQIEGIKMKRAIPTLSK